ncbi:MAG: S8 family serine peptidase [Cyclobacteriaceae bacterium]|nr:S8 family serine peptidase [Cyclobacteriaceae bacterium]
MNAATPRLLLLLSCLAGLLSGQAQTSNDLTTLQRKQVELFNNQLKKVTDYAKANSISVLRNTLEGRQLLLVDVHNGVPIYLASLNSEAAITTGASVLQSGITGITLEGEGMLIGVWDEGSVKEHIELGARVISREVNNPKTHSTHVTGTLIATGINASAKGMAPKAEVTDWFFDNDLAEMAALAKPDETSLLLSNHSYGTVTGWTKIDNVWTWTGDPSVSADEDYRFGLYGAKARALDELANLSPYYTIVWAAGNDRGEPGDGSHPPDCNGGTGYDCIIPEAVAKNIITVGAINKVTSYTGPASVMMSSFSSWGPTDDGRIKPDLVGAGVNLFSLSAVGTDGYSFSSGTSMATPNVTGSLALLQELYRKLHGGSVMKASTLKALAIHSAKEAGPLPGPDYSFGWGLLDVEAAAKLIVAEDGVQTMIKEETLSQGEEFEIILNPKANQKITATLVWNDPAGTSPAASLDPTDLMLVNDLDMKLVAQNGATQYPWLLDPASPSAQAIKGDNFRDNVEKLEFSFPIAAPYRLVVSHKGTLKNGSQSFSLVLNYQSSQVGQTLYWIGDSGNWNDNTHWSTTSGGSPAFTVPTSNDLVIVDDNSFDGIEENKITLQQNQAVRLLKWISNNNSSLDLQSNTLTVSQGASFANSHFAASGTGILSLSSGAIAGSVSFINNDLDNIRVKTSGEWSLSGDLSLNELEVVDGKLSIVNSKISLNSLKAIGATAKSLNLKNAILNLSAESEINGTSLEWNATDSKLLADNVNVTLDWNNVNFNGELEVNAANVNITGSNSFESIKILAGSNIQLANGSNQDINRIVSLQASGSEPVSISSIGKASVTLIEHSLLCVDYLSITNVDLVGSSIINAGLNSTIINSENWKTQACETVLFADFEEGFLCQNGLTEFYDKSNGDITTWQWNFGNEGAVFNESDIQNPFHSFGDSGAFTVSLTVSDGSSSHSYSKEIEIVPTSFVKNTIAVNGNNLMSVDISSGYQWYRDGDEISGATQRSYSFNGDEGIYQVVVGAGECNRSSDLVTITGVEEVEKILRLYPNPVKNWIRIQSSLPIKELTIHDAMGRLLFSKNDEFESPVSIAHLADGLYIVKVVTNQRTLSRRIVIDH